MKRPEDPTQAKLDLRESIEQGRLTIGQATRAMRKITGLSQKDYAEKVLGISPRILGQIERDKGNPRLSTLKLIGEKFGYKITFRHRTQVGQ